MKNNAPIIAALFFLIGSCSDNESDEKRVILLSANPSSLHQGETEEITVTSLESFPLHEVEMPISSNGGLVIVDVFEYAGGSSFLVVESDDATEIGNHHFELEADGKSAQLDISVLRPESGPGTVILNGAVATAGARNASMVFHGKGTTFDKRCHVHVMNADGVQIEYLNVVSPATLEAVYSISEDQEPMETTVAIMDDDYIHELPFTILAPKTFENQAPDQRLVKGNVGYVTLTHPEASVHFGTKLQLEDTTIEMGRTEAVGEREVRVPVRVPSDYEGDNLELVARTLTDNGATLEIMHAEVELLKPAYLALSPAKVPLIPGSHEVRIVASGIDLTTLSSLTLPDNESILLESWTAHGPDSGAAVLSISPNGQEDVHRLIADDGARQTEALLVVSSQKNARAHLGLKKVSEGDRVYVPIVVQGTDLDRETVSLESHEEVNVLDLIYIDETCMVAELEAAAESTSGPKGLSLNGSVFDYEMYIDIINSPLR